MKKLIFFIFSSFLLFSSYSNAQVDSSIYGVVRDDISGMLSVAKLNATNGVVSVISPSPFPSPYQMNSIATIDPAGNKYYLYTNNSFMGVDLLTGAITTNTVFSTSNPPYLDLMQFNPADGMFYAMRYSGGLLELVKVNTSTGFVTTISSSPLSSVYFMNALAAIDPIHNIYYLQGDIPERLYGFDLSSGAIVVNVAVDTTINDFQMMRFNSKDTTLYGIASAPLSSNKYLAKLNPSTGLATLISLTPFTTPLDFNAIATLDQNKRIYYVQLNGQLIGFDLSTGNIVVNKALTFPFAARFDLMIYCLECRNNSSWTAAPEIHITALENSCAGEQMFLSATVTGTPAASYSWSASPSTGVVFLPANTSTAVNVTFPGPGNYTVSFTATNVVGSSSENRRVYVSECTGLKESSSETRVYILPNPSTGIFSIQLPASQKLLHLEIYDALGRKIAKPLPVASGTTEQRIDLTDLESGIYSVTLVLENESIHKKIVLDKH